uniref:PAP-associated domain-containing protein n=1 Tax=Rhabditophanes sp. KR3021 TaxID=114890 RepID=A0AC35TNK0_9BILA
MGPYPKDFESVLPEKTKTLLKELYDKKGLTWSERRNSYDKIMSALPEDIKEKLPPPPEYRDLPKDVIKKLQSIHFSSTLSRAEKRKERKKLIDSLPEASRKQIKEKRGKRFRSLRIPSDYESVLGKEKYTKLKEVQQNKKLTQDQKWAEVEKIMKEVPVSTLEKLPYAKHSKDLPKETQAQLKKIMANKDLTFRDKLSEARDLIRDLPDNVKDKIFNHKSSTSSSLTTTDDEMTKTVFVPNVIITNKIKNLKNIDKLTFELERFSWRHRQNKEMFIAKTRMAALIDSIVIKECYPQSKTFITGSTLTYLGLNKSDLDLCTFVDPRLGSNSLCQKDKDMYYPHLVKIQNRFEVKFGDIIEKSEIIIATVPILRIYLNTDYDGMEVDISLHNVPGILNTKLLHYYSSYDIRYSQLAIIVKAWMKTYEFNDSRNGFLNSYSISLMVLHYLQCGCGISPPILPNLLKLKSNFFKFDNFDNTFFQEIKINSSIEVNKQPISELLIGFFDYYTRIDFDKYGISIEKGTLFKFNDAHRERDPIFIEEPFEKMNTARCLRRNKWNYHKEPVAEIDLGELYTIDLKSLDDKKASEMVTFYSKKTMPNFLSNCFKGSIYLQVNPDEIGYVRIKEVETEITETTEDVPVPEKPGLVAV